MSNKMKIIITEKQHKTINEALGVPDSILDAAEEFYHIFENDLKSIHTKEDEYDFEGNVDITLGDKTKININRYKLNVDVYVIDDFEHKVKIRSMGMGQSFQFDRNLMMKRTKPSTTAHFSISYVVSPDWEPIDLYNEFVVDKDDSIASLAHELKHKYDKQVKQVDLIGHDAEYLGIENSPRFGIPVIDSKFLHYLYYTSAVEDLVRATEVASHIKSKGITKSQFKEFLENDSTFKKLVDIKNFTFNKLVRGIYDNMDEVDNVMRKIGNDPESMTDKEKVLRLLEIIYINLSNSKMEVFMSFVDKPLHSFLSFLRQLGGDVDEEDIQVDKIKETFAKHILRYEHNPIMFFRDEIARFNRVANQTIKKISKLYAMAKDDTQTNKK